VVSWTGGLFNRPSFLRLSRELDTMNTSNEAEDNPEEDDVTASENVFSLNKIWDDCHLQCYHDDNQKKRWRCLWCNENYAGWHATKALIHLAKEPKMDIATCKAHLPDEDAKLYRSLFESYMAKRVNSSTAKAAIAQSLEATNEASAALLTQSQSRKKRKSTSSIPLEVSTITHSTAPTKEYIQLKITGESGPNAENKLSMAIADFIHGCGLPFSVGSHPKFHKVISLARAVGQSYQVPSRRRISSDLLEINYETYMKKTKNN
jgi:hypothetical protein